ncbi:HIT-like protein [Punctularia strigosozonata HHB-11173 SS5]|uniref:HIT-like protein n=1 Tax=Punctularia strigosozonata (strain HHB-11173) TaxID=741275 RepID=R7S170_PUNST|nr:HIT-like protein [Punctularia strigosozonata HHB-11173 SS5]EIN03968.1 HIT-like protein [Punctularia strigosozonata HHB-11173 SS5]
MFGLFAIFGNQHDQASKSTDSSKPCIFCKASRDNGFDVVYEDATYVVFRDNNPSAEHHLQVIPRIHINSVKSLGKSDASMLRDMRALGDLMLDRLEIPRTRRRLGFHIPPFNSVNHLHMHVQALPYRSAFRQYKYPVSMGGEGYHKGFSWFITVDQAISMLENGAKIRVLKC